ncbi:MAG TPA: SDR family oxidoreductase [Acidimicrobiia bacterium]|nr:SDR family oxidoreductase [Acidimicrobiia bacterium]
MTAPIALTGVTGAVGGRVARRLAQRGASLRFIARDPTKCPPFEAEVRQASYDDTAAMTNALSGAEAFLFVSGREHISRLDHHRSVVEAAAAAGVGRIVYTSFIGAAADSTFTLGRQHHATEGFIRDTGIPYVFLRNNLYTDFVPYFAGPDGVIRGPAGDGRLGWVTRDDIAQSAVTTLISSDHDGAVFNMTGPESIDLHETADRYGRFVGREISYHPETVEEAYASRAVYDAPDWEVEGWVTSYLAIANGEMDVVSDAVETLTGRPPQSLEDFLAAHPESYQALLDRS